VLQQKQVAINFRRERLHLNGPSESAVGEAVASKRLDVESVAVFG